MARAHEHSIGASSDVAGDRKLDGEFAALIGTVYEDAAAVSLDDILGDRQTESRGAGSDSIGTPLGETFKDALANFGRDTGAGVDDRQLQILLDPFGDYIDRAAARRVAQRVADQIRQHPR